MASRNTAAAVRSDNFFDDSEGDDTSALVPAAQAAASAAPAPVFSDDTNFGADELAMPFIKLGQALTREVAEDQAKAGQWIVSGVGAYDTLTVVPLGRTRTRERRIGTGNAAVTVCKSPDARTGYGDPGGACASCPCAQWTPSADGKNRPPECTLQENYAVYVPDIDSMAIVRFQKTGAKVAKVINTQAQARGFRGFAVTLSSVKEKNTKGNYATPAVTVTEVPAEVLAAARRMMPTTSAVADAYAQADASGGDAADNIPF